VLPLRLFTPCPWAATSDARLGETIRFDLATGLGAAPLSPGHPRNGWLDSRHVALAARNALSGIADVQPVMLCQLAEWDSPGTHAPHRSGHKGGHPLGKAVRVAVAELQRTAAPPTSPNAASQARSRLAKRAEAALAAAGATLHAEMRDRVVASSSRS
jgi:hypothetical protein